MKARIRFSEVGRRALKCIPNTLTLCNSLCGFFAILYMMRAYEFSLNKVPGAVDKVFAVAAVMIFSAMVFDAMDGLAARALNAASMHGIQMDSLSDMVTFGVAPAVMVSILSSFWADWHMSAGRAALVYCCSAIYLGGAALRLATYNVYAITGTKKNPNYFSGLPSPGAAAALCVLVFIEPQLSGIFRKMPWILPCYAAFLGLLMVSTVPYLHAGRFIISAKRSRKKVIFLLFLLALFIAFGSAALAGIVSCYILSGPVCSVWTKITGKNQESAA